MARFEVILQSQPEKYYRKVDARLAKSLEACFKDLEENPFYIPGGKIRRLEGKSGLFRYVVGHLRVIYEIDIESSRVGVLAILPRGDVYKRLRL